MILTGEFILRYLYNRPVRNAGKARETQLDRKTSLMFLGLFLSSILIFIRYVIFMLSSAKRAVIE